MLYTASFLIADNFNGEKYAVCKTTPVGISYKTVPFLFPNENDIMKLKQGLITFAQFEERYRAVLDKNRSRLLNIQKMLEEQERDIVFVCHCPEPGTCHRSLIVSYLVSELGVDPNLISIS